MSCSAVDLKAYFLGELAAAERTPVETHVRACQSCREELERLNLTRTALLSLEQEEAPQRIAFVSDKVFEPRWWQTIWHSGPVMGFASAGVLSAAILVHAFAAPGEVRVPAATPGTAKIEQRIDREVSARVEAAVAKAIAETEARQDQKIARVLDTAEKRYESQRLADLAAAQQTIAYYEKKMNRWLVAGNDIRPAQ